MNTIRILLVLLVFTFSQCQGVFYTGLTEPNDISIGKIYSFEDTHRIYNHRVRRQQSSNTTINMTDDHHDYYTSRFISSASEADSYWLELGPLVDSGAELQDDVTESIIQGFHRYYEVWDLKFDFPFYGHFINEVAVTTGGFLYTGSFYHDQIHLTQFIAPLQADFNPTITTRFVAQWDAVHNHDHDDAGTFTFQVSLFPNGTIYFVYKEIPLLVNQLNNDDHPVEVGLADAFYYDVFQSFFRIRYVFEYSRIQLNASSNLNHTAYIINPLPNCVLATNCTRCSELTRLSSFDCTWCPGINRCSDGFDRHSQEWIDNDCDEQGLTQCMRTTITATSTTASSTSITLSTHDFSVSFTTQPSSSIQSSVTIRTTSTSSSSVTMSFISSASEATRTPSIGRSSPLSSGAISGFVIVVLIIVVIIVGASIVMCIAIYGHKHPQSRIGLFMIENRPKARSLNKTAKYELKSERVLLE